MLTDEQVKFERDTVPFSDWRCDTCGYVVEGIDVIGKHILDKHEEGNATEIERVV